MKYSEKLEARMEIGKDLLAQFGKPSLRANDWLKLAHPSARFQDARVRLGPEQYKLFMRETHAAALWASYGFNVFQLSHGLAQSFLLTEPPTLAEGETLHFPFPSFVIRIPPDIVPIFDVEANQHWADAIEIGCANFSHEGVGELDDQMRIAVAKGDLETWRQDAIKTFLSRESWPVSNGSALPLYDKDEITVDLGTRILRNFLCWLEGIGLDSLVAEPKAKLKKKASAAAKARLHPTTFVLGKEVKLRPELSRMAREIALTGHDPAFKLRMRHVVRGHFKLQAHGPARQDRKRLWVQPYWRGPEGTEAWSHLYTTPDP